MGFQDNIDRDAGRAFYAEFYRQWRTHDLQLHTALIQTRVALRARGVALQGAGFVLWSDRSLIDVTPVKSGSFVSSSDENTASPTEWTHAKLQAG